MSILRTLQRKRVALPCLREVAATPAPHTAKPGDTLWLTKHALSTGIERVVAGAVQGNSVTLQSCSKTYEMGIDLHSTWDKAHEAALEAQRRKIVQLEKQLIAHRKMTFKRPA